ncbi:hypothetical protein Trydic_g16617 [Trypoxylus dichotomus]
MPIECLNKDFPEPHVEIQRFKNGGFDIENRKHAGDRERVSIDTELEALLQEDSCQTEEELATSLEVTQQAISKRRKAMGMIQKRGSWVLRSVSKAVNAFESSIERRTAAMLGFLLLGNSGNPIPPTIFYRHCSLLRSMENDLSDQHILTKKLKIGSIRRSSQEISILFDTGFERCPKDFES